MVAMDEHTAQIAMTSAAKSYSVLIFRAIDFTCKYGTDNNVRDVINSWCDVRHTIIAELQENR